MTQSFIFIGGVDRSGTTLLAKLLVERGFGISGPETVFKERLLRANKPEDAYSVMYQDWRFRRIWNTNYRFNEQSDLQENFRGLFEALNGPSAVGSAVIDHTPHNIRLSDKISQNFEDAVFIHIIRDPRSIFNSIRKLDWGARTAFRSAIYWYRNMLLSENVLRRSGVKWAEVKFEDLLSNPDEAITKLQLELDLKEQTSVTGEFSLPRYTQGQHALVNSSVRKDRIDTSKHIDLEERTLIEAICAPMMDKYDYQREPNLELFVERPLSKRFLRAMFLSALIEVFYFPINKAKNLRRRYS